MNGDSYNRNWVILLVAQLVAILLLFAVLIFAPKGNLSEAFRSGLESTVLVLIGSSVGQGATGNMNFRSVSQDRRPYRRPPQDEPEDK